MATLELKKSALRSRDSEFLSGGVAKNFGRIAAAACSMGSMTSTGSAAAPQPAAPIPAGRRVRISGLASRPELNSTHGRTARYDAERGRHTVELEGRRESVMLRPECLTDVSMVLPTFPGADPAAAVKVWASSSSSWSTSRAG